MPCNTAEHCLKDHTWTLKGIQHRFVSIKSALRNACIEKAPALTDTFSAFKSYQYHVIRQNPVILIGKQD